MKMKSMILMMVAVGCGLVAMLGVQQALSNRGGPAETVKSRVLVALTEIQPGTPLDDTNSSFKEMGVDSIPEGAVLKQEDYEGRAPKFRLFPGQFVLVAQLGEKGEFGAAMEIPQGMRVATVAVNATMTHSGLLKPGDRVDVLVTYKANKPPHGYITRTKAVLEYIQVWATDNVRVGNDRHDNEIQAKNVSLLVYPGQASLLKLAESNGTLHLTLRSRQDSAPPGEELDFDEKSLEQRVSRLFDDNSPDKPGAVPASDMAKFEPQEDPAKSFQSYVQQQAAAASVPVLPVVKPKRKWTIDIFHGEEKRTQEIELPDEPDASPSSENAITNNMGKSDKAVSSEKSARGDSDLPATANASAAPSSLDVLKAVGQLFGGTRTAKSPRSRSKSTADNAGAKPLTDGGSSGELPANAVPDSGRPVDSGDGPEAAPTQTSKRETSTKPQ